MGEPEDSIRVKSAQNGKGRQSFSRNWSQHGH